jgi:hypothetical protein
LAKSNVDVGGGTAACGRMRIEQGDLDCIDSIECIATNVDAVAGQQLIGACSGRRRLDRRLSGYADDGRA